MCLVVLLLGCGQQDVIVLYGRASSSGTYMYFKEKVLKGAYFSPKMQTLPGTAAVINAVSKDIRSIGFGGIGYSKGVRVLSIKKNDQSPVIEPNLENVVNGSYPISRYLYFYVVDQPHGIRDFINFVLSDEGQKICVDVGFYPIPKDKIKFFPEDTKAEKPLQVKSIQINGSDTMIILGQKWAEYFMKVKHGISVSVTGGGSGTGIAALIDRKTDVCMSSRPMHREERELIKTRQGKEVVEIRVALDGLAIFVHEANPLKYLTLEQLNTIYMGKIRSWKELEVNLLRRD